jgi:hypothetical protein
MTRARIDPRGPHFNAALPSVVLGCEMYLLIRRVGPGRPQHVNPTRSSATSAENTKKEEAVA